MPFSITTEVAGCPWAPDHRLVQIGLKGRTLADEDRPASNLVFLLDVSGSMNRPNKLPLLKRSMAMLVEQLSENDSVAIAVYAGASGLVLPPTNCHQKEVVLQALERLSAGGSTNGGAGIQLAYDLATQHFIPGGVNRVILCTDGDFNVGVTDQGSLVELIEAKASSGVFLSVLGFGMGNYKDSTLEKLADRGNGNYAYIDTLDEARKVLVEEMGGTLVTIAKDVKIQVEFNPAVVAEYRLIGYENRALAREDFANDKVDAGEIGAGHSVTALYEIALLGSGGQRLEPLRYQPDTRPAAHGGELALVRLRYKAPDGEVSKLIERPVRRDEVLSDFDQASESTRWAASIAAFGQSLRGGKYLGRYGYPEIRALAAHSRGDDPYGDRAELLKLVDLAQSLAQHTTGTDVASGH